MSQYFIKRGKKVHGPFSSEKVKSALESGKLKDADLISKRKDGPWQKVAGELQEPAPASEVIADDLPAYEGGFFADVQIPESDTAIAQFPTPIKKNENTETSEGEDSKDETQSQYLIICPDCNEKVSKRASSCPHCGVAIKEVLGIASVMSKAKEVAQEASKQASDLKQSTSEQFAERGVEQAIKHLGSSLFSKQYKTLTCAIGLSLLFLVAYFTFSGSSDTQGLPSTSKGNSISVEQDAVLAAALAKAKAEKLIAEAQAAKAKADAELAKMDAEAAKAAAAIAKADAELTKTKMEAETKASLDAEFEKMAAEAKAKADAAEAKAKADAALVQMEMESRTNEIRDMSRQQFNKICSKLQTEQASEKWIGLQGPKYSKKDRFSKFVSETTGRTGWGYLDNGDDGNWETGYDKNTFRGLTLTAKNLQDGSQPRADFQFTYTLELENYSRQRFTSNGSLARQYMEEKKWPAGKLIDRSGIWNWSLVREYEVKLFFEGGWKVDSVSRRIQNTYEKTGSTDLETIFYNETGSKPWWDIWLDQNTSGFALDNDKEVKDFLDWLLSNGDE